MQGPGLSCYKLTRLILICRILLTSSIMIRDHLFVLVCVDTPLCSF